MWYSSACPQSYSLGSESARSDHWHPGIQYWYKTWKEGSVFVRLPYILGNHFNSWGPISLDCQYLNAKLGCHFRDLLLHIKIRLCFIVIPDIFLRNPENWSSMNIDDSTCHLCLYFIFKSSIKKTWTTITKIILFSTKWKLEKLLEKNACTNNLVFFFIYEKFKIIWLSKITYWYKCLFQCDVSLHCFQ